MGSRPKSMGYGGGSAWIPKESDSEGGKRPLTRIEALWHETNKQEASEYAIEIEKSKLHRQAWSEKYKLAYKNDKPLPVAPDDSINPPAQKRLLIGDATFEKLHEILSENPAGVLSVRDELIGWLGELEKPDGRANEVFTSRPGTATVAFPSIALAAERYTCRTYALA